MKGENPINKSVKKFDDFFDKLRKSVLLYGLLRKYIFMPEIIIIAGANGTGKTTFSKGLIAETHYPFLNADEIEKELGLPDTNAAKIQAGRIFFERLRGLSHQESSLILESTLAGGYLIKILQKLKAKGYVVKIVYVFLANVEICIERIKHRVTLGGHFVPDEDVRRRFYKSREKFWNTYKNLADDWVMYFNSTEGVEKVALGIEDKYNIENEEIFNTFIESLTK